MNFKKILLNALILLLVLSALMFCISTHAFDDLLNLIGIGVPMWSFLSLIALILIVYKLSSIASVLNDISRKLDQPYYPDDNQE